MKKLIFVPMFALAGVANASCYGLSCTHEDPWNHRNDCPVSFSKTKTIRDDRNNKIGVLTFKYSKRCGANWSTLESTSSRAWPEEAHVLQVSAPRDSVFGVGYVNPRSYKKISSPMINGVRIKVKATGRMKYISINGKVKYTREEEIGPY